MNVFRTFWQALAHLAGAFDALATTIEAISEDLRQRTGLETPTAISSPAPKPAALGVESPHHLNGDSVRFPGRKRK